MAKATRANGPSFTDDELRDPDLPRVIRQHLPRNPFRPVSRFEIGTLTEVGGEFSSAGSSSEQSSRKESGSSKTRKHSRREHAQTTGNLSDESLEELLSDVRSMGGNGPETETAFVEEELKPYSEMTKVELQDECRGRTPPLPVSGTVAELIERLEADDATEE